MTLNFQMILEKSYKYNEANTHVPFAKMLTMLIFTTYATLDINQSLDTSIEALLLLKLHNLFIFTALKCYSFIVL